MQGIVIPWGNNQTFSLGCPIEVAGVICDMFPQAYTTPLTKFDALLNRNNNDEWILYNCTNDLKGYDYWDLPPKYWMYKLAIYIEEIIESKYEGLILHGCAISNQKKAIIFPAERMSGKTTLLKDLLYESQFHYISDDILFIDDLYVSGIAMPLRLRKPFIENVRSGGRIVGESMDPDGGSRFFYVPTTTYVTENVEIVAIVQPAFQLGKINKLSLISGREKIHTLLKNVRKPNDMAYLFKVLSKLTNRLPIYRLDYNDIEFVRSIIPRIFKGVLFKGDETEINETRY